MERSAASAGRVPGAGGQRVWFLGNLMTIKCGLGPGDVMTLIEAELRPGHAPPVHVHHREDEAFYVLEGSARFRCGADDVDAEAGDCVYVPRGAPHAFRIGTEGAHTLMFSTSPLLARFMAAAGVTAGEGPAPAPSGADLARVNQLAASFDMDVIGPPLT